jgi:hypothetical protein
VEGIAVVVLLVVGIGVVMFAIWVIVFRGGYAEAEEFPDSVEHAHLRRVAEAGISSLSPGAIRLAEKERGVHGSSCGDPAQAREFWRRFAAASSSVERDPAAALGELRGLPDLLEEALRAAGREVVTVEDGPRREDGR